MFVPQWGVSKKKGFKTYRAGISVVAPGFAIAHYMITSRLVPREGIFFSVGFGVLLSFWSNPVTNINRNGPQGAVVEVNGQKCSSKISAANEKVESSPASSSHEIVLY